MTVKVPIVVDLGRTNDQVIGDLREGSGQIMEDVEEVMKQLHMTVDPQIGNRFFLPIVVTYSRRRNSAAVSEIELNNLNSDGVSHGAGHLPTTRPRY